MPFDSGSNGFNCTILVASVPVKPATPSARRPPRPIPASLSQTSRRGTADNCCATICQIPASRSGVVRDGSIRAVRNRENDATITSTGGEATCQPPTGTFTGGNPQVALRLTTRTVTEPVGWILRRVLRSQGDNPLAEPRRPPQEWAEIR